LARDAGADAAVADRRAAAPPVVAHGRDPADDRRAAGARDRTCESPAGAVTRPAGSARAGAADAGLASAPVDVGGWLYGTGAGGRRDRRDARRDDRRPV